MGNRAYLLSLPFTPIVFGEAPPSGAVAFAQYSLPFFWASLFDATSIVRAAGIHGLAAPRCEAGPRSERRLRACAEYLGWRSWPVAERWIEFMRSLGQSWIAVDVHELEIGARGLAELLHHVDLAPDDLSFRDRFGTLRAPRPIEDAVILAGIDHEGATPPRPLAPLLTHGCPPGPTTAVVVGGQEGPSTGTNHALFRQFGAARLMERPPGG